MSVETAVTEVEKSVEGTVAKAEAEVKTVAEAVVADVKAEVAKEVKVATVAISTEEKLVLRTAELEFLKAQMEIQRLSKITEAKSKEYQTFIEGLFTKYLLSKAEYIYDAASDLFKKL